jgi:hypothetical protein
VSGISPQAPLVDLPPKVGDAHEEDVPVELAGQDDWGPLVGWTGEVGAEALSVDFPLSFPEDVGFAGEVAFPLDSLSDEAEYEADGSVDESEGPALIDHGRLGQSSIPHGELPLVSD